MIPPPDPEVVRRAVQAALDEDLGAAGDITTEAVVDPDRRAASAFVARGPLVVAGLPVVQAVLHHLDPAIEFRPRATEGGAAEPGQVLAEAVGRARPILSAERTALNFLGRMCGIATATRRAVEEVAGTGALILDTRKTAPGLRAFDKYAVAAGGGTNHRMGLYDVAMIKDTHLAVADSIERAVSRLRRRGLPTERILVEVDSLAGLERAIASGAGRAVLDNMTLAELRRCVAAASGRIVLEASGGLRPGGLRAVAETGVQFLSVGWITHSAPVGDVAMDLRALD